MWRRRVNVDAEVEAVGGVAAEYPAEKCGRSAGPPFRDMAKGLRGSSLPKTRCMRNYLLLAT